MRWKANLLERALFLLKHIFTCYNAINQLKRAQNVAV
jgi:hypothetical protein